MYTDSSLSGTQSIPANLCSSIICMKPQKKKKQEKGKGAQIPTQPTQPYSPCDLGEADNAFRASVSAFKIRERFFVCLFHL